MRRVQVLFLGDSISLGYRDKVRVQLKDSVKAVFPEEQGKSAADIFRMLYEWSNEIIDDTNNVGLIYWNAGLWDVVDIYNQGVNTDIEVYKQYLVRTYERLRFLFPNAKICFANTTAVYEERYDTNFKRRNCDIMEYNAAAAAMLEGKVDFIDDLHSISLSFDEDDYVDATHFSNRGNHILANHINHVIGDLLHKEINAYKEELKKNRQLKKTILNRVGSKDKIKIAAWGAGNIFDEYKALISEFCDIAAIVDKDKRLHGKVILDTLCIAPCDIAKDVQLIVITIDNVNAALDITDYCIDRGIGCCTYTELMEYIWPLFEQRKLEQMQYLFHDADPDSRLEMTKYIGVSIPENTCNLDCAYCYLQLIPFRRNKDIKRNNPHLLDYVRYSFSNENLGGSCLIGLTGSGETLFADKFEDICLIFLKEGHYLHIVTNGVLNERIISLIKKSGKYAKNILFKLSFHYLELKQKHLLDKFRESVKVIEESGASYTIELMPYDALVPFIPEIQQYTMENFGAYPHLTIGRDERDGSKLMTKMSYSEFVDCWKVFDSEMFDMRMNLYMVRGKNCKAGEKSIFVDMYSGRVSRCVFSENVGNIYYDNISEIQIDKVGDYCPMNYCFNCHVYATLGILPVNNVPTYMTIRDRVTVNGKHWLKENMRDYLDIKL